MQNNLPIYTQLATLIRDKIRRGEYRHGEAIPSERKLAEAYGINRLTVRAAIASLQAEGLITKEQGKGNFVTLPLVVKSFVEFRGFTAMLKARGIAHSSKVLLTEEMPANYQLSNIFGVPKGEPLYRILRLRLGNGQPIAIEDTYVPLHLFEGLSDVDYGDVSLFDTLNAHGIRVVRSQQLLNSYFISGNPAKLLGLRENDLVYRVTYQTQDENDRLVEYTVSLINPHKAVITTVLK